MAMFFTVLSIVVGVIGILFTALSIVVTVIGIKLSRERKSIAEEQKKVNAFKERVKVFEEVRSLFILITGNNAIPSTTKNQKMLTQFARSLGKAFYLLGGKDSETSKFLQELCDKAHRLINLYPQWNVATHDSNLRARLLSEQEEICDWVDEKYKKLYEIFSPYLTIN